MSGLLNVGARALLANQVALQTAGNNIANVNTPGYSRQSVQLQTSPGQFTGGGFIGKGVDIITITRAHNEFLTRQAALAGAVQAGDTVRAEKLRQLEDVFLGGTSGLGAAINDMLNAFSDVANAPTDLTARSVVLTRADETAARFRSYASRLDELMVGVKSQLDEAADSVNSLTTRIAAVNGQIAALQGTGQPPNDLLDHRDQLIRELNQFVQTTTIAADDGTLGVFIGGSQALVLGTTATAVRLDSDEFSDSTKSKLVVDRGGLDVVLDETMLGGGEIAGLLRFQNSDLVEARNMLGRMALAITTTVNDQHRLGLDLDGQAGGDFFVPITLPNGLPADANTGTATVGVTVNDPTIMAASDYEVRFGAGTTLDVIRLSDGQVTSFAGPVPVQVDGLTIDVTAGAAAAGDRFVIKPFSTASSGLTTAFSSPRDLAVANQIEARLSLTNTGGVAVASLKAQTADPNLTAPVTLTFTAAGTFDVAGVGTGNPVGVAYAPGQPISYNGWTITLKGIPQPGDVVTIDAANPAFVPRNAGNADALLGLRDLAMFDGAALTDGYAGLMSQVGTRMQGAEFAAEVSQSIAANLERDRAGVSGVNLDEEAAKLIQFQQAYQASAKLIQIAQSIFDTLIQGLT
ncbi:MAG TPA: flagellar hook-associated protein FlgK [Burkholderiaceae bacterium]|nr:flagellar hook-associated protein FlgK [Burkholderiaceae bacterium]